MPTDAPVRARPGFPRSDCERRWRRHRRWLSITLTLAVAWIPFSLFFGILLYLLATPHHFSADVFAPAVLFGILFLTVGHYTAEFRCPRCGNRFYTWAPGGVLNNSFSRHCHICGLKRWHCPEPSQPTTHS